MSPRVSLPGSIYCPRCERALCCPCALLDTGHAPFRDLRAESRRRQDELRSLRRDLRRLRGGFEAALARLRSEALGMIPPAFPELPTPASGHPNPEGVGLEQPGGIFPAPEAPAQDLIPVFSIPGTDVPEVEVALEDNLEEDPVHPKIQSVSSLEEIHVDQPLPCSSCTKRPLPCVERGSQMSPKIMKLECDHEAGPSRPQSHWEFQTEPGPSTWQHNCVRSGDAEVGSIIICSSDDSDEDTVVVTVTPEPPPC
ncbi:PREDICTED: protein PML [Ficedula albicollis]|uniref:protein PML n=1 Tax=Ficedula albicollis TaxID=59894 RepID=UPI0007AD7E53|nr:PREDICTED: protein PML [Ficedula albicollis]